jgi:hypothetical protein
MAAMNIQYNRKTICFLFLLLLFCLWRQLLNAIKMTPELTIQRKPPHASKLRQQTRPNPKTRGTVRPKTTISRKPRGRRKDSKVIYYLHIHKAGGSTMCKQAAKQKLSVNMVANCNVQKDQHCCGKEDSLEAQIRYANETMFDFVACEKEMYDNMATDYYDYAVTLRDSATRYVSHWKHIRRLKVKDTLKDKGQHFLVGNFSSWWEFQPDNFITRMICGSKCLDRPKFQITPQLFQYTLQRLSLFSHVLFLEDMEASYATFARAVGWNTGVKVGHENRGTSKNNTKTIPENMTDNNLRYDPFMTALDDALYAFARERYDGNYTNHSNTSLLVKEYANSADVQDYFRDGKDRNCKDPCCGECSKWR